MNTALHNDDGFDGRALELPKTANTVAPIVRLLVEYLVRNQSIPSVAVDDLVRDVLKREELGSTAIGHGVAMPHTQSDLVCEPQFALGRCIESVHWPRSLDDEPVSRVCLFISPKSAEMRRKSLEIAASLLRY